MTDRIRFIFSDRGPIVTTSGELPTCEDLGMKWPVPELVSLHVVYGKPVVLLPIKFTMPTSLMKLIYIEGDRAGGAADRIATYVRNSEVAV
jgi:hypothetical protein